MEIENEELYNELREKVALAFETQTLQFLPDEELHEFTMKVYPQLNILKEQNPNLQYLVRVTKENDGLFYIHILLSAHEQLGEDSKNFIKDLSNRLNILLDAYLTEHPELEIEDCNFKIVQNKKSLTITIIKKKK